MPFFWVSEPNCNLRIEDRPLGYQPSRGLPVVFQISARDAARKLAGLGDDAVPFIQEIGPLKGKAMGRMSPDGLRGWRVDWDSTKGFHVNWWDRTDGAKRVDWFYGANTVPGKTYNDFLDLIEHAFPHP